MLILVLTCGYKNWELPVALPSWGWQREGNKEKVFSILI